MAKGLLGEKVGMTQVFTPEGNLLPVTVIETKPSVVLRTKTVESDGYYAVQLGYGAVKDKHVTKPAKGQFAKAGATPVHYVRELRLTEAPEVEVGAQIKADIFQAGDLVDVTGTAKGKGFAGTIKRWNFRRGPMAHGSKSHREPGSMGPRMSGGGGTVYKGKKLPGRMGGQKVTLQHLTVVRVDAERNLLLIKGAIPGPKGSLVLVKETIKPAK